MGDTQPKYTINLERCELLKVSALVLVSQSQAVTSVFSLMLQPRVLET